MAGNQLNIKKKLGASRKFRVGNAEGPLDWTKQAYNVTVGNENPSVAFTRMGNVCGGRWVIAGTTIERDVVRRLREKFGEAFVVREYKLTREQVRAC